MSSDAAHALRAVIIDDEPLAREGLRLRLAREHDVRVVAECATASDALSLLADLEADVLFVDIQMPGMSGLAMVEELPRDTLPAVVFVTAHAEHAVRAFRVRALDYLLKPFDDETLRNTVARVREYVTQARRRAAAPSMDASDADSPGATKIRRLAIRSAERIGFVNVDDVEWFEAAHDYIHVHAGKQTHRIRMTMNELATGLDPLRFTRIHRTAIVAIRAIRELQPYFRGEHVVVLHDGTKLRLSRNHRDALAVALGVEI